MNLAVNRNTPEPLAGGPDGARHVLSFHDQEDREVGKLDWTSGEVRFTGDANAAAAILATLLPRIPGRSLSLLRSDGTTAALLDWSTGKIGFIGSADKPALVFMKFVRLHSYCGDPGRN
ncbi:MAG: hypothetical protein ACYDH9_08210 [Limisphaerales bacterium]